MKKFIKFQVALICFIVQAGNLLALLAIPTEDLLGPEVCPTGSFCIDTGLCTNSFYTTKSGAPFYCGPLEQIDSKICCIETEAVVSNLNSIDKNDGEEDDEVDILSIPYSTNPADADISIYEMDEKNSIQKDEMPYDNLESILEDALEQELNSTAWGPNNVRETEVESNEVVPPFQQHDFEPALSDHTKQFNDQSLDSQSMEELLRYPRPVDPTFNSVHYEPNARTVHKPESQKQRVFSCPCEKGEKGDPGPKGEPGEPGKIIYIPVFVNTASSAATGVPPVQFSAHQPGVHQPSHAQIPQHPNPSVVSYSVPVNIPPTNPPIQAPATANGVQTPPQHSFSTPSSHPQQAYHYQATMPQAQQQQPSSPPTTTHNIQLTDEMRARLSRQTQMKDPRFANRRQ